MQTTAPPEPIQPLILKGSGYGLEIAPSYEEKKSELLKHSALIVEVKDATADAAADNQIKKLATMRIEVEKSRTEVKRPALDFGKDVDSKAKAFSEAIIAEEERLKKARGSYAQAVIAERNRVLREQREAQEREAKRVREEEVRQAEAARKAEADRKAAEEALWNAETPEETAAASQKVEAAQKEVEAVQTAPEPVATPAPTTFVPAAPKGVKMVPNFEVTDIHALYQHNVGLVTLTERRKEILDAIERGMVGDTPPEIPGLRVFMEPKVSAR